MTERRDRDQRRRDSGMPCARQRDVWVHHLAVMFWKASEMIKLEVLCWLD